MAPAVVAAETSLPLLQLPVAAVEVVWASLWPRAPVPASPAQAVYSSPAVAAAAEGVHLPRHLLYYCHRRFQAAHYTPIPPRACSF